VSVIREAQKIQPTDSFTAEYSLATQKNFIALTWLDKELAFMFSSVHHPKLVQLEKITGTSYEQLEGITDSSLVSISFSTSCWLDPANHQ